MTGQNPLVMNESDIFNDAIEGGGVEPSINETIRESIQYSFVSSEHNETDGEIGQSGSKIKDSIRD